MRLREIVELMLAQVHAPGRNRMQQRLPQMGARTFNEGDARAGTPSHAVAEPGDELNPRGAAPDHHNAVQRLGFQPRRQSVVHRVTVASQNQDTEEP